MSTPKIIAALLLLFAGGLAIHWFTKKEPEPVPNDRVSVESFRQLQSEMDQFRGKLTEAQVERILDLPHRTTKGQIVKVERPDSPDASFELEEAPGAEGGNLLNLYLGPRKQSISVLLSPDNRIVVAAEYRVRDTSVKYVGPLRANRIRALPSITPRIVPDIERRELEAESILIGESKEYLNRPIATASEAPKPPPLPSETPQASPAPPSPPANAAVTPSAAPSPDALKPPPAVPSPVPAPTSAAPIASNRAPANYVPGKPVPFKISLPSGKTLTDVILAVGVTSPSKGVSAPGAAKSYQDSHPNGNARCQCSVSKGKLNGMATIFYEDGSVESTASYVDGALNDVLCVWDENRDRLLYAKYTKNKKDGLYCLFQRQLPWLVQEWSKGALQHEYLVKYVGDKSDLLDTAKLQEGTDDETAYGQARQQLDDLQKRLLRDENDLKQRVREDFRKEPKVKPVDKTAPSALRNGRP